MKKLILVAGVILAVVAFSSTAQAQIKTRVGPMLAFTGGDFDETGVGIVGEFGVAQKVSIAPQFILYFPGNDVNLFEFNFNANYYFFNQDIFELYGLGGLNIAHVGYDNANGDYSNTELGLNLGIGTNFEIGKKFVPFAEFRLTIGEYDQIGLGLGVKFNLN
ncbi:MAG TPA: outer membrane beta-barrel protein [Cyclobacteriaceae bacterium]|nr:outer membrane beta-barrel protein [Cyclobacteriaceae bacterium]